MTHPIELIGRAARRVQAWVNRNVDKPTVFGMLPRPDWRDSSIGWRGRGYPPTSYEQAWDDFFGFIIVGLKLILWLGLGLVLLIWLAARAG
jgi:hypothetical protein